VELIHLHAANVGAPYVMNAFMGIINLKPPILASSGSLNPNVIEGLIFLLNCIKGKQKRGKEATIKKY
jgi:hypothetical protein